MEEIIDRGGLVEASWQVLLHGLLLPQNPVAFALRLFVVLGVGTLALMKIHALNPGSQRSLLLAFFCFVTGGFALLQVGALCVLYVLPQVSGDNLHQLVLLVFFSAAFLLLLVPFTRVLFKAPYWTSMGAWMVAALLCGICLYSMQLLGAGAI